MVVLLPLNERLLRGEGLCLALCCRYLVKMMLVRLRV